VYATSSLPLGVLEVMVQDSVTNRAGYGFYPVTLPDDLTLSNVAYATLSPLWRTARDGRIECRAIGETWRAAKTSIGLKVPSAVVPEAFAFGDFNVVFDPTFTDFDRLVVEPWQPLEIDPRIHVLVTKTIL
jgi:hypothetical protein